MFLAVTINSWPRLGESIVGITSSRFMKIKIRLRCNLRARAEYSHTRVLASLSSEADARSGIPKCGEEHGTNGRRKRDLTAIHNAFYTFGTGNRPRGVRRLYRCRGAEWFLAISQKKWRRALRCDSRACRCLPSRPFVRVAGRSTASCRELECHIAFHGENGWIINVHVCERKRDA